MNILRNLVFFATTLLQITQSISQPTHARHSKSLVILEPRVHNVHLEPATNDFSRLRDYYLKSATSHANVFISGINFYPYIVIANIVASAANKTLVEVHELYEIPGDNDLVEIFQFPRILPSVALLERTSILNMTVFSIWTEYCSKFSLTCLQPNSQRFTQSVNNRPSHPHFFLIGTDMLTFLYCGVPERLQISPWSFGIFMIPFDNYIWTCLLVTVITLAVVLKLQTSRERMSSTILKILAPLLGCGAQSRPSKMLILWMIIATILGTLYSGEITSSVISPTFANVFNNIQELYRQNYTLHMDTNQDGLLDETLKSMKPSSSTRKALEYFKVHKILDLNTFIVTGYDEIFMGDKTFTILPSRLALYFAQVGSKRNLARTMDGPTRQCYVGEEYIPYDLEFFVILSAENNNLVDAFSSLEHAGIVQRFLDESRGMMAFGRVQDRVRLASKTNLNHERNARSELLRWCGKTVTIFLLWIFGTFISLLLFGGEIFSCNELTFFEVANVLHDFNCARSLPGSEVISVVTTRI